MILALQKRRPCAISSSQINYSNYKGTACTGGTPTCGGGKSALCTGSMWVCFEGFCTGNVPLQSCPFGGAMTCANSTGGGSPKWQCGASPVILDVDGSGYHLTDTNRGVFFKLLPGTAPIRISWTDRLTTNAWLALDRNGNGQIDDLKELFGKQHPPTRLRRTKEWVSGFGRI